MIYAGIGARKTPPDILSKMFTAAKFLAKAGYTLRSGGAEGADETFEAGCDAVAGTKEIYLPYPNFRKNESPLHTPTKEARLFTKDFHPNWPNLGCRGRDYMARNAYQVMGLDLSTPADFILCWTPNGKVVGGTGQALRIAAAYKIPVINFGNLSEQQVSDAIMERTQHE